MTQETRDTTLQTLFANAEQDLVEETFTSQVMSQTDTLKRNKLIGRIGLGLMLALLALPLQDMALVLMQIPLIDLGDGWLTQILAPLNSVGSLLSLGLIGMRMVFRRIFA